MNQALLIFAKNLIKGHVKTRLALTLGNDAAINIYKRLLQHTCMITEAVDADRMVFYSSYIEENDVWRNNFFTKQVQQGGDLGKRMENAFVHAFDTGYDHAVIIGTDCMELTPEIIKQAFVHLKKYDVVIGPATDGGYYLLGLNSPCTALFKNVAWSTSNVLNQTIETLERLSLTYNLLQALNDIDEEKDLLDQKISYD